MGYQMITLSDANGKGIYFRKKFNLRELPQKAVLRMSALGIYRGYINGRRLDDQVFLPGRTSYDHRIQYQEYDVTASLETGENVIAAELGNGWCKKCHGLYARLTLTDAGGKEQVLTADDSWEVCCDGPLRFNDMKLGEYYDARRELPGWNQPEQNEPERKGKRTDRADWNWRRAELMEYGGELIAAEGERILEQETFSPCRIIRTPDGSTVLDFGQNIAGYMEFTVTGAAGCRVDMVYGETLDKDGNFTQKNLSFAKSRKTGQFPQTVSYVLREGRQTYRPRASVHGFQYVKLVHWPQEAAVENFRAIAVYSELRPTGTFRCSEEKVNQLVSNCSWSMKGNFLDIPTDCPTRERAGWTGDIMVYTLSAIYQADVRRFLEKWLSDVILEQREDGRIPNIVPDGGLPFFMDGAAGWADAIVKIPWLLYWYYGDREILERAYPAIQKHIAFMERRAKKRKIWHLAKGPHHDYLIDCGFHWGEWLEPGGSLPAGALRGFLAPDMEVASACFAWSAGKAAEIAGILGKDSDRIRYQELHEKVKAAYRKEFLKDGMPAGNRQCRYVRPIALDLATEEEKPAIVARLNEMMIENRYRIGTGFLTTPHLCRVLSDYGFAETAFRMLENEEAPGWLYEVNQGATTIWENWYGKDEQGNVKNSLNHYSPGAVIAWLYSCVGGITPLLPGFQKVRIAPVVGGRMEHMDCAYDSAAGRIEVSWKRICGDPNHGGLEKERIEIKVVTPAEAEICLPDGQVYSVGPGTYRFTC